MEYRGHILIVFAMSLSLSPWAINFVLERLDENEDVAPTQVVTQAQARNNCDTQAIETAIGRFGCNTYTEAPATRRIDETMTGDNPNRRIQSSGALFISAPDG